jgi:hypothetical protein
MDAGAVTTMRTVDPPLRSLAAPSARRTGRRFVALAVFGCAFAACAGPSAGRSAAPAEGRLEVDNASDHAWRLEFYAAADPADAPPRREWVVEPRTRREQALPAGDYRVRRRLHGEPAGDSPPTPDTAVRIEPGRRLHWALGTLLAP